MTDLAGRGSLRGHWEPRGPGSQNARGRVTIERNVAAGGFGHADHRNARIAEAQRRRWAAYRAASATGGRLSS
jgi:hypothetical protein